MRGKRVAVAGAGPSGMLSAILLCQKGYRVDLYERAAHPGARFKGGFQVLDNYSEAEDPLSFFRKHALEPDFQFTPLFSAILFSPDGTPHVVRSEAPYGYLFKRGGEGSLDHWLRDEVLRHGVDIHYGTRAPLADIVATGPSQPDGIAREVHFSTDQKTRTWVLFDPKRSPGGYSYLFTSRGSGTFGTAITRHFKLLDRYFHTNLEFFRNLETIPMESIRRGYSYMNFFLKRSAVLAGQCLTGEAGGFQDFLFGIGIRQACITADLAVRSVTEPVSYDSLWRHVLRRRQQVSLVNRFLFETAGSPGIRHFLQKAESMDFKEFLESWIRGSRLHTLLLPIVMILWNNRGRCHHPPIPHWCRRR